ncbi:sensor histidine kinase [Vibrio atypicus]|uniref:sensor histidine kinase n=1 Tax=Vibrio atypicus TaxID=558271 RepID=UPI001357C64C|nr:ATP-binding protein [Vibrio atypicus]
MSEPNDLNRTESEQLSSKALIRRYRTIIYGALLLIILLTLGNTLYLSSQIRTQVVTEQYHQGLQSMLALNKTISVSLNHVDSMRNALETAYNYPELIPDQSALDFINQKAQGSLPNAPWQEFPADIQQTVGQLYVRSNPRDYSFDIKALLTMLPEVTSTHQQHDDFQWSYYYDANQVITYIYPWLSATDILAATQSNNMDDALNVIYEAGGTFPLELINPKANPSKEKVWTTPYMDAGGKGMMISLLAPIYHQEKFIGAVGTDITLKVLDKIITDRPLEHARLAIVDENGLVIGDSAGTLQGKSESVVQDSVLSLISVGEAHNSELSQILTTPQGYWVSYPLPHTPWRLVLEITNTQLRSHIVSTILPNLVMATAFTLLLLCVVLYQHWQFSQPALRLAQFVDELPHKTKITLPNIPSRWRYWFQRAADTERDRRTYLETIEKQTHELEQRVDERTQELKDAMEVLEATQEELVRSEKLSGLGSLVAGVAHELNTPIGNAIVVASSLKECNDRFVKSTREGLRRSVLDEYIEQSSESADSIERNLRRAGELISSFKQVAVDQSSYQRRTFDLSEILHELRITMSPNLTLNGITLKDKCETNIYMNSYPGPLTQVLMNLLSNALVHAFSDQEQKVIHIEGFLQDQQAMLTITDNGQGIDKDHLNKIFDPFFTTRLGQGGSGLGLNIVYNLVTGLLGGDISVKSEIGHGTCFVLQLPLNAPIEEEKT